MKCGVVLSCLEKLNNPFCVQKCSNDNMTVFRMSGIFRSTMQHIIWAQSIAVTSFHLSYWFWTLYEWQTNLPTSTALKVVPKGRLMLLSSFQGGDVPSACSMHLCCSAWLAKCFSSYPIHGMSCALFLGEACSLGEELMGNKTGFSSAHG